MAHFLLPTWLLHLLLASALFSTNHISRCQAINELIPPFPLLSLSTSYTSSEIIIDSESDGTRFGSMLMKELIDVKTGKSALSLTRGLDQSITYSDSNTKTSYVYKADDCREVNPEDSAEMRGLWRAKMMMGTGKNKRSLYFFGVAAIWLNAENAKKAYNKLTYEEASSRQWFDPVHRWSVLDEENKSRIYLYFIERGSNQRYDSWELTLIEVENIETKKIDQTISILSVDKYITPQESEIYLEAPVGFGCHSERSDQLSNRKSFEDISSGFRKKYLQSSFRFDFEVTETSFPPYVEVESTKSNTLYIQYASHRVEGTKNYLELFRLRSSRADIKLIYHNLFKVVYYIDLATGKCSLGSFDEREDTSETEMSFLKGLSYKDFKSVFKMMLEPDEQYHFIKITNNEKYIYEASKTLPSGQMMRIVQVYKENESDEPNLQLKEIIMIKINQNKRVITDTFRFSLMKTEVFTEASQIAEVFDVSEECYLNNDFMQYNKDFAWFKVSYALPEATIHNLIPQRRALRSHIYNQFLEKGHLGVFRVPRMELVFGRNEIVLRALLIDTPKLMLQKVEPFSKIKLKDAQDGQLSELASDLQHCEELCRLNLCEIMSYCQDSYECIFSWSSYSYNNGDYQFEKDNSCNTYRPTLSVEETADLQEVSLQKVLGRLQHDKYGSTVLPAPPPELVTGAGELDDSERKQASEEYLKELQEFFEKSPERIPLMSFAITLEDRFFIMLPSKFVLEEDPLEELHLLPKQEGDGLNERDKAPAFHRGLVLHKYTKKVLQVGEKSDNQLFNGLNYDHCALACVDLKCSSFSYCHKSQECLVTNIYKITDAHDYIQYDTDCFIAQRDFLSKFTKFPDQVQKANQQYQEVTKATNVAECAHHCMTLDKCLSFDYCPSDSGDSQCFFFDNRLLVAPHSSTSSKSSLVSQVNQEQTTVKCNHYSRSYLADFVRVEHRQIKRSEMDNLKSSTSTGLSVDRCAEVCLKETSDCSAFQFCINLNAGDKSADLPFQTCQTIESKPSAKTPEELFEFSDNCHIFSLSPDSGEVQMQELALEDLISSEGFSKIDPATASTRGLSLGPALVLYFLIGMVTGGVGFGFVFAYHRNKTFNRFVHSLDLKRPEWLR